MDNPDTHATLGTEQRRTNKQNTEHRKIKRWATRHSGRQFWKEYLMYSWAGTDEWQYQLHCVIYRKAFLKIVTLQGIFIHFIISWKQWQKSTSCIMIIHRLGIRGYLFMGGGGIPLLFMSRIMTLVPHCEDIIRVTHRQ